jgi:heptosyltransferase II
MTDSSAHKPSKDIIVIAPNWVGDAVMTQPLLALLKQQHPDASIDVLAPTYTQAIYTRMAEVREVLALPFEHGEFKWNERREFARSIKGKYAHAVVLPNSWKSALVPWFAGVPKRTGWRGEMRYGVLNDVRVLNKQSQPLMVERFAALAGDIYKSSGLEPKLVVDVNNRDRLINALQLDAHAGSAKPIIAFCPGAEYGPAKRWPTAHFGALAKRLIAEGKQVWILGSPKDAEISREIQQGGDEQCVNLIGKTTLGDAVDLMSLASAVVANDSGLMHIAAALGIAQLSLFGSSSPTFTPPLSKRARVISLRLECSPCFKRNCPLGHTNCLVQITPELIAKELKQLVP